MSRTAASMWLGCSLLCALPGCAHMVEMGAINRFVLALDAEKPDKALTELKEATSSDFADMALRVDEAVEDLKILRLPTDKPEIVSVKDLSETEKLVTVESGPAKRRLEYRLIRNEATKKWVVDDVYMKQKKDGITATKSVTEQMDLLLSVREFLKAWSGSDRKEILSVTTPSLRSTLDGLPPAYLAELTRQVMSSMSQQKIKPEAQLDDDVAVVKVPRKNGQLMMNLRLVKDHWLVSDLAVETKGEDAIPSLQKHAIALDTAVSFLKAYGNEDRTALATLCTDKFYRSGLAPADLKSVALPTAELPAPGQIFRIIAKRAELVVPTATERVKVNLIREEASEAGTLVRYRVEDVSLHGNDGDERRLSSMFTAHAILDLFSDALAQRDLPTLRKTSTSDFNRRVWERLKQSGPAGTVPLASEGSHTTIDDLPLGEIPPVELEIVETKYNGAVTEIHALLGTQQLTYLLREHAGEVRVDDVLLPEERSPRSLKEITELVVPMREFIAGLETRDLGLVQRTSSNDYNKMVWSQTDKLPQAAQLALEHLTLPITGVKATPDEVMITLGDERWGGRVMLVREYSKFVVDEVFVIRGLESAQRMRMKQAMRLELAGSEKLDIRQNQPIARRPIRDPNVVGGMYQQVAEDPAYGGLTPPEPDEDAFTPPHDDEPGMMPEIDASPLSSPSRDRTIETRRRISPELATPGDEPALDGDDADLDGVDRDAEPAKSPASGRKTSLIRPAAAEEEAGDESEPTPPRKPSKPDRSIVIKPKRHPSHRN